MTSVFETLQDHARKVHDGLLSVSPSELEFLIKRIMIETRTDVSTIFTCGNGGSASISQHWACDHSKGCFKPDRYRQRVVSLATNIPMMTAIANDISYEDVFAYQLRLYAHERDILIVVSSSGNSSNIVKAIEVAKEMGIFTVALTGFDPDNKASKLADYSLHIPSHEYEVVEDCHQALMHILAKHIRKITT